MASLEVTDPIFFPTPGDFHAWLSEHHASVKSQWVGFYKKSTGKPSITWEESVDEALCYGWIDGLRKSLGEESHAIRFTPRKPKSVWSGRNFERVEVLTKEGRMQPAGLEAYEKRYDHPQSGYRVAELRGTLTEAMVEEFKSHPNAWDFYQSQPPGYLKQTAYWVMSAKRDETRARRLATLVEDSAQARRIKQLRSG